MTTALERLNALSPEEAEARLLSCCGSAAWARGVAAARPFRSEGDLAEAADRIWRGLSRADWLEAFAAHPRIGPRVAAGAGHTAAWSREEQRGTDGASPGTLASLDAVNREYESRFGHVFIVCASGRTADEMLSLARQRLGNEPGTELALAAEEQRKITQLRLEKLLAPGEK